MMPPTVIVIPEHTSPLVHRRLYVYDEGTPVPRDLSGILALRFYVKPEPDAPDGPPLYSYPNGGITILEPRSAGRIAIQFSSADIPAPGNWFFRIDADGGEGTTAVL